MPPTHLEFGDVLLFVIFNNLLNLAAPPTCEYVVCMLL